MGDFYALGKGSFIIIWADRISLTLCMLENFACFLVSADFFV